MPGAPLVIRSIDYSFPDSVFKEIVMRDSSAFVVKPAISSTEPLLRLNGK